MRTALGLVLFLTACSAAPPCPELPAPAKPPEHHDPPAAAVPADDKPQPTLVVTIAPKPTPQPHVDVFVTVRVGDTALTEWSIAKSSADQIAAPLIASDIDGPIATSTRDDAGRVRITLARAPKTQVRVGYSIAGKVAALPIPPPVMVDPDRFEAMGDALLALPDALDEKEVLTAVRIESKDLGVAQYTYAASSFGAGPQRDTTVRGVELRNAMYLAGPMGRATFEGPEGHDEAAWLGYTTFDPRPASADMAGFRTAARQLLKVGGEPEGVAFTLLFASDSRSAGAFVAARKARSVLVRLGLGEPWSGPVRIAVATEVLKEWIGERLWIGPTDPAHEAEAYWFSEGVTRGLARDLLFRFGLITTAEDASEVEGLASVLATSPYRNETNASLAARAKEPKSGVVPLLVARGALYATRIDALARQKSKTTRGLADVLRDLYAKGAEKRGPLPVSAWTEAIDKELATTESTAFTDMIDHAKPIDVPDGALGPCFKRVTRKYVAFDLGFDQDKTLASPGLVIAGLEAKGPAAKAGLTATDVFVSMSPVNGRADVPVELVVARNGAKTTLKYKPEGASHPGQGWDRKRDVPDDACTR